MSSSRQYLIGLIILILAFLAGRYSQIDTKTETKTESTDIKQIDKDSHTKTTIVSVKNPSGEEVTTTIITKDTDTEIKDNKQVDSLTLTQTTSKKMDTNISFLVGLKPTTFQPVYGISAGKPILGPITVGVWGLTDTTFGVSLGVQF